MRRSAIAAAGLWLASAQLAFATHIDPADACDWATAPACRYGDFAGDDVMYLDVTEHTQTGPNTFWNDPHGLFGAPTVAGNQLDFDPSGFSATTADGGVDLTDVELQFTVMANTGLFLDSIDLTETGTFDIFEFVAGSGTATTLAEVTADVIFEITEVDGVGITPLQLNTVMTFTPSDGDWNLADDGEVSGQWMGHLLFDPGALLAAQSMPDLATKVKVTLDNRLKAISESGTVSFIDKKDADGLSIVGQVPMDPVPEPGSFGLLALGLALLAAAPRRR